MKPLTLTTSNDGRAYARIGVEIDWVIPGDIHLPFHDQSALNHVLHYESKGIFIQGDLIDFYWISRWPKSVEQTESAGYEATRQSVLDFVSAVSKRFDFVVYGAGNHEDRVANLARGYPGFDGKWWWIMRDVLPTTWHYLPHGYRAELPQRTCNGLPIIIEHGDKAIANIKVPTAENLVASFPGQCTIIGHNHRVQQAAKTTWKKGKQTVSMAFSCGHLSDIKKNNYSTSPQWQQGFTTISTQGYVSNHMVVNGEIV
jgi:hypothetical protein